MPACVVPDRTLDATGLTCPLPVLRARKLLNGMAAGEVLEVRATDNAAPKDFRAFCVATGHELVSLETIDAVHVVVIRKAG